jgi:rSAM/selenodomain-associated transferase 1
MNRPHRPHRFNGKNVAVGISGEVNPPAGMSCGIAFMAKASAPGRAKTRLVPPLTFDEAAALNTTFLQDVADNVLLASRQSAPRAPIAGFAAYGPPGSEAFFRRTLPAAIGLIEAWLPNFGDCLLHTIEAIFARGHGAAVVLNSDSPTLLTALLIETAAALARPGDRAVLGPSSDGGYYLLGLKSAHRRLFEDIAWSTERVAAQTLQRAREIDLEVHQLPVWYDVDDVAGLRRLHAELCEPDGGVRHSGAHNPHYAAQTAKLMHRLGREHNFTRRADRIMQVDEACA